MKKQWTYHIKRAATGEKIIGGTITAPTMEEAAKQALQLNKVDYLREEERSESGLLIGVRHRHMYKEKEVFLYVCAHPEYLQEKE